MNDFNKDPDGNYEKKFSNGWYATVVMWPSMNHPYLSIMDGHNETQLDVELNPFESITDDCIDKARFMVKNYLAEYINGMNQALREIS